MLLVARQPSQLITPAPLSDGLQQVGSCAAKLSALSVSSWCPAGTRVLGKDLGMVGKVRDRGRLFSHRAAVFHGMNHERNARAFLQSACACQNSHTLTALSGIDQAGDPCPQTRHKTLQTIYYSPRWRFLPHSTVVRLALALASFHQPRQHYQTIIRNQRMHLFRKPRREPQVADGLCKGLDTIFLRHDSAFWWTIQGKAIVAYMTNSRKVGCAFKEARGK